MARVSECPLCGQTGQGKDELFTVGEGLLLTPFHMDCPICGTYFIHDHDMDLFLPEKSQEDRTRIASLLNERRLARKGKRESKPVMLLLNDKPAPPQYPFTYIRWDNFIGTYPAGTPEQIDRTLLNLGNMSEKPGQELLHSPALHLSMFTRDPSVASYLADQMSDLGYVEQIKGQNGRTGVRVHARGWSRISELNKDKAGAAMNLPGPWSINWEVLDSIDKGGQGTTYLVSHKTNAFPNAVLKVLKKQTDEKARTRMYHEVSNLTALSAKKAKVPTIYESNVDAFKSDLPLYIVMEKIEGQTLDSYIQKDGPLDLSRALALCRDICLTLKVGHDSSIYHRDLKPKNIMVRDAAKNDCVLLDYGLSFNALGQQKVTGTTETIKNEFITLTELTIIDGDKRNPISDVTQACGILYYLLTAHVPSQPRDENGRAPHKRPNREVPSNKIPGPQFQALDMLFERGFAHSLADRFQSVDDLIERLGLVDPAGATQPRESTQARAKRLSDDMYTNVRQIRATAFRGSVGIIWQRIQDFHREHHKSLGYFTVNLSQAPVTLENAQYELIANSAFVTHIGIQGQTGGGLGFGYLFAIEGEQCVILKTPLTAHNMQHIAKSPDNLTPVHYYNSDNPSNDELRGFLLDYDATVSAALEPVYRSYYPPKQK